MPTTTRLRDYIGMKLINPDPGISSATDYLGRNIGSAITDYLGRSLLGSSTLPAKFPIIFSQEDS